MSVYFKLVIDCTGRTGKYIRPSAGNRSSVIVQVCVIAASEYWRSTNLTAALILLCISSSSSVVSIRAWRLTYARSIGFDVGSVVRL